MFKFLRKKLNYKTIALSKTRIRSRFKDICKLKLFVEILMINYTLEKELHIKDMIYENDSEIYTTIEWLTDDNKVIDIDNIIQGILLKIKILYENKDNIDEFSFLNNELKPFFDLLDIDNIEKIKI